MPSKMAGNLLSGGYSSAKLTDYNYHDLSLSISNGTNTIAYSYDSKGDRLLKGNEYYLRDYKGRELESVNLFGNGMLGRYAADKDENIYFLSKLQCNVV